MPYADLARPAPKWSNWFRLFIGLSLLPVAACTRVPAPPPPAAVPTVVSVPGPTGEAPRRDIHWVQSSAEYHALTLQTYRFAQERLRAQLPGRAPGTWAVILDADETIIDNTEFQQRAAVNPPPSFTRALQGWWTERRARAVPGAKEFLDAVASLGGRIVIVSNRDDPFCPDTRANLQALGLRFDAVLCRVAGVSDKNPRFASVANGSAAPGLPPLEVLMWVGDNIQDFPSLTQEVRLRGDQAFDLFGRSYVVIPNPMYGSWEDNPPR